MRPRRILITGSRGFVGRHLMTCLGASLPRLDLIEAHFDITDPAATQAAMREYRPDACVHLAAISAIPAARRDPDRAWRINLFGTLNVARAMLAHAPSATMLFASSADAYGASFRAGVPLSESAVLAPQNTYSATKASADLALGAMVADGLRVVRARPFNHTGPGQSSNFVIAAFAEQVARIAAGLQPPVLRTGALDPLRDFLDVRDVCAAYTACLDRVETLPTGYIVNLASGVPRRIGDILYDMLRLAQVEADVTVDPARLRPTEIPSASGDSASARALLGWQPAFTWEQTLEDVLADWRVRVDKDR